MEQGMGVSPYGAGAVMSRRARGDGAWWLRWPFESLRVSGKGSARGRGTDVEAGEGCVAAFAAGLEGFKLVHGLV